MLKWHLTFVKGKIECMSLGTKVCKIIWKCTTFRRTYFKRNHMARVFGQIYGKCFKVDLLSLLKFAVKTVEVYYTVYLYIYIYIYIYIYLFYNKYTLLFLSQSIWCASGFINITDYWQYNKIGHCWC